MEIKDYIAAAALLLTLGNLLWTKHVSNQDKSKAAVDALKELFQAQGLQIVQLQLEQKNMPSQENFHKLQLDVVEMKGEQRVFAEQIKPVATSIKRIEEFLITEVHKTQTTRTRK